MGVEPTILTLWESNDFPFHPRAHFCRLWVLPPRINPYERLTSANSRRQVKSKACPISFIPCLSTMWELPRKRLTTRSWQTTMTLCEVSIKVLLLLLTILVGMVRVALTSSCSQNKCLTVRLHSEISKEHFKLAGHVGVEPTRADLEFAILPLYEWPISLVENSGTAPLSVACKTTVLLFKLIPQNWWSRRVMLPLLYYLPSPFIIIFNFS